MTEQELIREANEKLGESCSTLLEALQAFYMNGCPDEMDGDVESPTGHFYRVDRWVVVTDSQGFHDVEEFDTELLAHEQFEQYQYDYSSWYDEEE